MYAYIPEIGGGFFERVCTPSRTTAIFHDPTPHRDIKEPEPHYQGSDPKGITRRAAVGGALAWGRRKPLPAQCPSTARKPPTHHAQRRRHAPRSIACRCAPHRRNPPSWWPRDHAKSSSMSWSKRSSTLGLTRPLLVA